MEEIVSCLEIGPISQESFKILKTAQNTDQYAWGIQQLREITDQITRTENLTEQATLNLTEQATFKCEGIHLKKVRAWAKKVFGRFPFSVEVELEEGLTVVRTEGEEAHTLNFILDGLEISSEQARSASLILDFVQTPPNYALPSVGERMTIDDLGGKAEYFGHPIDIIAALQTLNIPYNVVEKVLVPTSRLKTISAGEAVLSKDDWENLKKKYPTRTKLVKEIDSLLGL